MIRVMIAEDQALVRGALAALLTLEDDIEVVAQAGDGRQAVELGSAQQPDIALVDIEMPRLSGLEVVRELATVAPQCRVLVVTTFARAGYLQRAVQLGVWGYLLKDARIEELTAAIRTVHSGRKVMAQELMIEAVTKANPLTERETEILGLAKRGLATKDIAKRLYLSEGTVRNYLSDAISKLQVQTRQDAIRIADENGWLL